MTRLEKKIAVDFCFFSELSDEDRFLFESAIDAREKAQAPYSHYKVGAAVMTYREGAKKIYSGCNVERATHTQTTHAEQNAIDSMITEHGTKKILKICVVGANDSEAIHFAEKGIMTFPFIEATPVPCGHCLQIIWENCMGDPNVKLLSVTPDGIIAITTIGDAFPMRFGPKDLGVEYK